MLRSPTPLPVSHGKDSPSHSSVSKSPNGMSDTAWSSFIRVMLYKPKSFQSTSVPSVWVVSALGSMNTRILALPTKNPCLALVIRSSSAACLHVGWLARLACMLSVQRQWALQELFLPEVRQTMCGLSTVSPGSM